MYTGEVFEHCTIGVLHHALIIIYFVLLMAISCGMNRGYLSKYPYIVREEQWAANRSHA
jgi:hypothetical protein